MLEEQKLDFHLTFRQLTRFRPALMSSSDSFIGTLLSFTSGTIGVPERDAASKQWRSWLEKYAARIESEKDEWVGEGSEGDWQTQRENAARLANPRFVLRQWVLEEVIAKVEAGTDSGRSVLAKVMQVRFLSRSASLGTRFKPCVHPNRWHVIPTNLGVRKATMR